MSEVIVLRRGDVAYIHDFSYTYIYDALTR